MNKKVLAGIMLFSAFAIGNTYAAGTASETTGSAISGNATGDTGSSGTGTPGSATDKFTSLDANKDGAISMEEATKMKGLSEKFQTADANKDGKLDTTEFADATPHH